MRKFLKDPTLLFLNRACYGCVGVHAAYVQIEQRLHTLRGAPWRLNKVGAVITGTHDAIIHAEAAAAKQPDTCMTEVLSKG